MEVKVARIDEHIQHVKERLDALPICRHLTDEGDCIFVDKLDRHDKTINQWTGALAAVALLCSLIGAVIGAVIAKVMK